MRIPLDLALLAAAVLVALFARDLVLPYFNDATLRIVHVGQP